MSALIKELLLDYSLNRLHVDMKSDLTIAIQSTLSSKLFTRRDAEYLNAYLSGYTAEEIAKQYNTYTVEVEACLERIFTAIETYSGYTDTSFMHKLESTRKYRKGGLRDLEAFLIAHSKEYSIHEIKE